LIRGKQILIILILQVTFTSCKKEPATEIDAQFVGSWKHIIDESHTIYLSIENNSKGFIERYENGQFKSDTQQRKWLIKKDKLYFGWTSAKDEKFSIDKYPAIASSLIINNHDTVQIGERYIILEGEYYKD
jgi:hypothetical protein